MPDACNSPLLTLQGLLGLLDTVPEYVAILDRNMRYLFMNEARARCVGLPRKHIIGRSYRELWGTPHLEKQIVEKGLDLGFVQKIERLCKDARDFEKEYSGSVEYSSPVGLRRVDYVIGPFRDVGGSVVGASIVSRDVCVFDELAKTQAVEVERAQTALKQAPITVFNLDLSFRYSWAFKGLAGVPASDFFGRRNADIFVAEDAVLLDQLFEKVLARRKRIRVEMSLRSLSRPEERWIDITIQPLFDSCGQLVGITMAAVDIDDTPSVSGVVEALNASRDAAEAAIRQANRERASKSRALEAVSHDLAQPYQAIRLFHDVLDGMVTAPPTRHVLDKLGLAILAGEGILGKLREIVNLEAETVDGNRQALSLDPVLARIRAEFAPKAAAKGLRMRVLKTDLMVWSNPSLVHLIIRLLVENAIQFTEKGGLLLGCRRRGGNVRIEVWDTGTGISADDLDLIFEDFYQRDNPARNRARGLGLGLGMARRAARLIKSELTVRSRPGRGSVFSFSLRRAGTQAGAQEQGVEAG